MRQQINLYQPALYEQQTRLSAGTAASMLGAVIAALLIWRIYGARQVTQLTREVQTVRAQQQRQAEFAAAAGAARVARGNPLSLQTQAKQLATKLRERQSALELLRDGAAGSTGGFADRLEALARRRMDGVWLDHIVLGGARGVSSLAGHTLDSSLVPRYLQTLAGEPALRGTHFDEFRIGEPPSGDTRSIGAVASPSAGDLADASNTNAAQTTAAAIRFSASDAAPPTPQPGSRS
jgi:hypothetical protein